MSSPCPRHQRHSSSRGVNTDLCTCPTGVYDIYYSQRDDATFLSYNLSLSSRIDSPLSTNPSNAPGAFQHANQHATAVEDRGIYANQGIPPVDRRRIQPTFNPLLAYGNDHHSSSQGYEISHQGGDKNKTGHMNAAEHPNRRFQAMRMAMSGQRTPEDSTSASRYQTGRFVEGHGQSSHAVPSALPEEASSTPATYVVDGSSRFNPIPCDSDENLIHIAQLHGIIDVLHKEKVECEQRLADCQQRLFDSECKNAELHEELSYYKQLASYMTPTAPEHSI